MISPNLRAALEFDEQTRASRAPSESSHPPAFRSSRPPSPNRADGPAAGGLPPPPRPKSRASSLHKTKSPPMSPTTPLVGDTPLVPVLHSPQPPPPTPLSPGPSSGYEGMTTAFNPYINPPPLLSHFYAENNAVLAHSRSFSLPTTMAANNNVSIPPPPPSPAPAPPPQASSSPRTSESPRREKPPSSSPIQMSSPESAGGSTGSEGRSSFQRHLRYLSSLQKVEKMLAKGKTRAVGKGGDGRQRVEGERRGSVGASAEQDPCDKMQRERLPGLGVHRRRIRASASERVGRVAGSFSLGASSAPSSPVACECHLSPSVRTSLVAVGTVANRAICFSVFFWLLFFSFILCFCALGVADMVDPAVSSGAVAGTRPESRRSVGLLPDSAPVAGVMPRPPLRPLISHGRRASAASTAASSDESHEAPSTPDAARISISSTLYHDSNYSFHDPHLPDAPWTPPGSIHRRNTMDSDRESFIDLASPTFSPRLTDFTSNASMSSDSQLSHHYHHPYATDPHNTDAHIRARAKPSLPAISTLTVKPPLPTSPKPNFGKRSRSAQPPQRSDSLDSPSVQEVTYSRVLPPTTNLLHPHERAEGVRKTRKIAQMFGQTPAAPEALVPSRLSFESTAPNGLMCAPTGLMAAATAAAGGGKHGLKHHRGAVSMSVAQGASDAFPQPLWPPPEADASHYVALSARRHSTPLTPDTFSFMDDELVSPADSRSSDSRHTVLIEVGSQQGTAHSDWSSHLGHRRSAVGPTSPTSFMDLSEEDMLADGVSSIISLETPKGDRRPGLFKSSSSIYSFTSEDLEEEDRRRKRDKLAKLHRFLGSRVPLEVVLGQLSIDAHPQQDLPPVVSPSTVVDTTPPAPPRPMDGDARKAWVRRRRSSSAGELGGKWFDDLDRLKEELNNKEKAQNVKRAVKMEKVRISYPHVLFTDSLMSFPCD